MSNELATINNTLTMWEDSEQLVEIRKLFAPKLTDLEFQIFVGMGKTTGLNPFLKEIWAIKYGKDKDGNDTPAQIFIGRDGYRKAAQGHSEYDYHQADAVYENDKFEVVNGEVRHSYQLSNRGKLMGAYCVAKRHKSSKPQYVFADLDEYSTGQSLWADPIWKDNKYGGKYKVGGKPATMIKKVAESQCLRAAFQDLLGGTYGEEEIAQDNEHLIIDGETGKPLSNSEKLMNKIKAAKGQTIEQEAETETETIEETGELATPEQMEEVHGLVAVKGFANGRMTKAMGYYGIETLSQLTKVQAEHFISQLNKEPEKEINPFQV